MVFSGKDFVEQHFSDLAQKIASLPAQKIVSIYDPAHLPSRVYTNLKAKMAQRLGVAFVKVAISDIAIPQEYIHQLNADAEVTGIMIQLPLTNSKQLIAQIDPAKDIDGLRSDSPFVPATVRAVIEILKTSPGGEVVVVGSLGQVGSRLVKELHCVGMDKNDFSPEIIKSAEVIISCTGQCGLISKSMVKPGVVAIDVGFPDGDFAPDVAEVASFFTPVPGGVGPVTVFELFANLTKKHE